MGYPRGVSQPPGEDVWGVSTRVMADLGMHLWKAALLVQEGNDTHGLEGHQVQGRPVVGVVDEVPGDVLRAVLLLLQGEHMLHKELLQVLIGEVDAELLKAVEAMLSPEVEQGQLRPCCGWCEQLYHQPFAQSHMCMFTDAHSHRAL